MCRDGYRTRHTIRLPLPCILGNFVRLQGTCSEQFLSMKQQMQFHALRAYPVAADVKNVFFHKARWRHFLVVIDRFENSCVEFFSEFCVLKLFKSVHFGRLIHKYDVTIFSNTL